MITHTATTKTQAPPFDYHASSEIHWNLPVTCVSPKSFYFGSPNRAATSLLASISSSMEADEELPWPHDPHLPFFPSQYRCRSYTYKGAWECGCGCFLKCFSCRNTSK